MTDVSLQKRIHALNHKWWHDKYGNRLDRNKGELICLFHSEQSEATEGVMTDAMDDKLPHRRMDEVEMADTRIRILDYAEGIGHRLDPAGITVHPNARFYFNPTNVGTGARLAQHAIIHLHISKAMEAERKGRADDVPGWLNGALHLIALYCWLNGYDLDAATEEKLAFNTTRVDHTHEARARADGKKW